MSSATYSPAPAKTLVCCATPTVVWLRDGNQVFLVDEERQTSSTLRGTEATIWDLVVLAYPYPNIVAFLSLLLHVSADEARIHLMAILGQWQAEGLVNIVVETEDD
jgi:hypothetical protein